MTANGERKQSTTETNSKSKEDVERKCQACGKNATGWIDIDDEKSKTTRRAVVCEECCEQMDADMWVLRSH